MRYRYHSFNRPAAYKRALPAILIILSGFLPLGGNAQRLFTYLVPNGGYAGAPFNFSFSNTVQGLYYPSDFSPTLSAGEINGLYLQINGGSSTTFSSLTIKLGHTSATTTGSTYITGLTTVLNTGSYTITPSGSTWTYIPFTSSFSYNGISNLVVEISHGGRTSGSGLGLTIKTTSGNRYTQRNVTNTSTVAAAFLPGMQLSQLSGPAGIASGIQLWLKGDSVNYPGANPSNSTAISTWNDVSGNGNNATVLSGQNTPVMNTAQINGKDVVKFTRTSSSVGTVYEVPGVDIRAVTMPQTTIFTVYRQGTNSGSDLHGIWGDDNGNWDRFFMSRYASNNGAVSVGLPTGYVSVPNSGLTGDTKLLTSVYDNGVTNGSTIYFNALPVSTVTDNSSTTAAQTDLRIGFDGDDNPYNGDIAEMIVYNRKLSDCEIKLVNRYLGYKYGVTLSTATISPTNAYFCTGSSTTLTGSSATSGATFQWMLNGSLITGATSSTYATATTGNYQVIASVGGCSDTSAIARVQEVYSRLYVDSSVASSGTGASWLSPLKTLTEALNAANGTACAAEIWVKKGTYYPMSALTAVATSRDSSFRITRNNIKVYGGFAGSETLLSQRNVTTNVTTLSGDIGTANDTTDNVYHVMAVFGTTANNIDTNTVVDGFTITKGNADGSGSFYVGTSYANRTDGAGLMCTGTVSGNSSPKIENCTFTKNFAIYGAGLYSAGHGSGASSPTVRFCTFSNNNVSSAGGGYLAYCDGTNPVLSPKFTSCTFSNNTSSGNGGAVWINASSSTVTSAASFTSCTFSNNTAASEGGAIYHNTGGAATLTLKYNTFTGNKETGFTGFDYGGAMVLFGASTTNITGGSFNSNSGNFGGAILTFGSTALNIDSTSFSGNTSSANGTIYYFSGTGGNVSNCSFTSNKASTGGGIELSTGTINVSNCIFSLDSVTNYGACLRVNSTGTYNITNSNFLNTWGGVVGAVDNGNGTVKATNCIFSGNKTGQLGGVINNNGGTSTFTQCVMTGNATTTSSNNGGGAIHVTTGSSTLNDCTLYNNTTASSSQPNGNAIAIDAGGTAVLNNTIVWGAATNQISNLGTATYSYSDVKGVAATGTNISANPQFYNAADPDGADNTWATADDGLKLNFISPAVDAGSNGSIPTGIITDVTGATRIQNTTVDMGAYEGALVQCPGGTRVYVDSAVAYSGDGTSWSQAFKTAWEGLTVANRCTAINEVWVAKGTYYPMLSSATVAASRDSSLRILRNGIKVYGGFAGTETLLTQRSVSTNTTILSGDIGTANDSTDNVYHVVTIVGNSTNNIDTTTIVDGFTITRGRNNGSTSITVNGTGMNAGDGGGMLLAGNGSGNNCSPLIQNCTFTRNAGTFGVGIYNAGYSGGKSSGVIRNCSFITNTAANGAGMSCYGTIASPTVSSCTFTANSASGVGAAMECNGTAGVANVAFSSCTFSGNASGGSGGALYLNGSTSTFTIANSSFSSNTGSNGGGVMANAAASLSIASSTFTANRVSGTGGGLYSLATANNISSDSFSYNYALSYGGGAGVTGITTMTNTVFLADTSGFAGGLTAASGTLKATSCKFLGNKAGITNGNSGGGAFVATSGIDSFTSCVFYGNLAKDPAGTIGSGGAYQRNIGAGGSGTLINCVFANNSAAGTTDDGGGGVILYSGAMLVEGCTFSENTTGSTTNPSANAISTRAGTTLTLQNSIVWGAAANQVNMLGTTTYNYSDVKGVTPTTTNLNTDPLFVNASDPDGADNVWATSDDGLELKPCSPAMNLGSNALIPSGITTDITGAARIQQTTVDMGAYEGGSSTSIVYVNGSVTASGTGASWASPFKTVTEALNYVHTNTCVNEIWVKSGTYYPMANATTVATSRDSSFRIYRNGIKIYGGFAGTETAVSQRNIAANPSILSGDIGTASDSTDNVYHVFTILPVNGTGTIDTSTRLDGLIIRDGNGYLAGGGFTTNGFGFNHQDGGGLYFGAFNGGVCNPQIVNCTLTHNAANYGGGIYLNAWTSAGATSKPIITNCSFTGNNANNGGGAIFNNGNSYNIRQTITGSGFTGNLTNGSGAAMYNYASVVTLATCTYTANKAVSTGGAILNNTDSITISGCSFSTNRSSVAGGAIYNATASGVVSNTTFTSDSANSSGGAVNQSGGVWTYANCSFTANVTSTGNGAAFSSASDISTYTSCSFSANVSGGHGSAVYGNSDTLSFSNCSFSSNVDNGAGVTEGGALTSVNNSQLTVTGCSFSSNTANNDRGGALSCTGYSTVVNSTFTGNTSYAGGAISNVGNGKLMTVSGSTFSSNSSTTSGGAIISQFGSTITISNSSFTSNSSTSGNGGVIYSQNNGIVTFANDTLTSNRCSGSGGGICNNGNPSVVSNCIFKDNRATGGNGGGVYGGGTLTITNSVFERDTATTGGAAYSINATRFTATGNLLLSNRSMTSGGGSMYANNSTDTIVNNVFVGNKSLAGSGGGALNVDITTGNLSLIANNTFYKDTAVAGTGGAMRLAGSAGSAGVYNNIFWSNTAPSVPDFSNTASGTAVATVSNNYTTPDPLFLNPSSPKGADGIWGTSDDGLQLTACSPAINTGTNPPINAFATDALGAARIQQTTVDPGAYESPNANSSVTPSVTIAANPAGAICSGTNVLFTATPVNGGTAPVYQWLRNGLAVGAAAPTYADATLTNGGTVQVRIISNASCRIMDTAFSNIITMVVNPTPVISGVTSTNPTTCGGANGSITINGLTTGNSYTVNYSQGGVAQAPVTQTAAAGAVTLVGLPVGSYSNFAVTLGGCTSTVFAGPVSLVAPAAPAISSVTPTNPTTCGGSNGSIALNGLTAAAAYTVNYSFGGTPQIPVSLTANGSGVVTITGLVAGSYSNFYVVNAASCTSATVAGPVVLNPPASPAISSVSSANPTTCGGTNGSITLNGLTASTGGFTITYFNGTSTVSLTPVTSTAGGSYTISNLPAGTYSSITATLNNCSGTYGSSVVLSPPATPAAPTASNNGPICSGATLNLNATPTVTGGIYSWTGPGSYTASAQNPSISNAQVTASGMYSVTVTVAGCTSAPGTTTAVVNQTPATPAISSNSSVCVGDTLKLFTTATGVTYSWTGPAFSSALQNPFITNAQVTATGTYTLIVSDPTSLCASAQATLSAVVYPVPVITSSASSNPLTCGSTSGSITLSGLTASAVYTVNYLRNSIAQTATITASASGNLVITGLTQGTYTNITVKQNGCASNAVASIVLTDPPTPAAPSASSNSPVCQGTALNLSATGQAGAAFSWTGPNSFTSTSPTPAIASMQAVNAGTYSVTQTVAGCVSPAATTTVVMSTVPAAPGAISGTTTPCAGTTNTYSISSVATATSYTWTIPATTGWSGSSTTTSISVTAGTASGSISVAGVNVCGTGTATTLAINVNAVPAQPGAISGPVTVCNATTANYSVAPVANTASYTWSLPSGWAGSSTTSGITGTVGGPGSSGNVTVIANNVCGPSTPRSLAVMVITIPAQPGAISGSATPCINSSQTYSVTPVSGATGYTWTYPTGGSPVWIGGSATAFINLIVGANSGNITVAAGNQCGSSTARALPVAVIPIPAQPGAISGKTAPCVGAVETYRITPVAFATSYIWNYPASWSGAGVRDTINMLVGASGGTITVAAVGLCGNSPASSLSVTTTPVVTSGVVLTRSTPSDTVCAGTPVTYTATATGGGSSPAYVFRKNGAVVFSLSNTYTDYTLANGDVISVTMASSLPCVTNTAAKDSIRMVVNPLITPGININSVPPITLCAGSTLTFTTNIVGGGPQPTYQWYKNGALLGVTTPNYTTSALANGDTLQVTMTTSATCPAFLLASSNKVGLTVANIISPSLSITANPSGIYTPGTLVVFTLTQSGGGTTPGYQWIRNGVDIIGETGTTYTTSSLAVGDQVRARMLSSLSCAQPALVQSNVIAMQGPTGVGATTGNSSWDGSISLYPNPTSGHFTVMATWAPSHIGRRTAIDVLNALGQSVYHLELAPDRKAWSHDVWLNEGLANGTYMLRVSSEDGMNTGLPFTLNR